MGYTSDRVIRVVGANAKQVSELLLEEHYCNGGQEQAEPGCFRLYQQDCKWYSDEDDVKRILKEHGVMIHLQRSGEEGPDLEEFVYNKGERLFHRIINTFPALPEDIQKAWEDRKASVKGEKEAALIAQVKALGYSVKKND